ncbi:MAG TPA: glycosyltransferase family 4 protein [Acidothermaceae bacterium]|nr:glycosyltransferase family 4 protein [Acidothermaceae bacterium]
MSSATGRAITVLVYPRESNPYQPLLYGALTAANPRYRIVEIPAPRGTRRVLLHPFVAAWSLIVHAIADRRRILHIHWMYAFKLPGNPQIASRAAFASSMTFLFLAKLLRYRIVWTVHNVLPHQTITSNDLAVRRRLARTADAVIVHSTSTLPALAAAGISVPDATVIPHPSYIGRYPVGATRSASRESLGVPADAAVCLFFGRIEPYKNVPALISAFSVVAATQPDAYLVVAGACKDPALRAELTQMLASVDRATSALRRISDDELGSFFAAADVVACPFLDVTTSGSAMLALSFGVPIVAPRIGALADLPDDVGFFYSATDADGLSRTLARALSSPDDVAKAAARASEYAASMTWARAASATDAVYRHVLGS